MTALIAAKCEFSALLIPGTNFDSGLQACLAHRLGHLCGVVHVPSVESRILKRKTKRKLIYSTGSVAGLRQWGLSSPFTVNA